jgi:hypothetical protein
MNGSAPLRQNIRLPALLPDLLTLKNSCPFGKRGILPAVIGLEGGTMPRASSISLRVIRVQSILSLFILVDIDLWGLDVESRQNDEVKRTQLLRSAITVALAGTET